MTNPQRRSGEFGITLMTWLPMTVIRALGQRVATALAGVALAHLAVQSARAAGATRDEISDRLSDLEPAIRPAESETRLVAMSNRPATGREWVRP